MVSARSTVSIARTTPAQKPRGEQSTIFRSGLAAIGAILGPKHPLPTGRDRSNRLTNWARLRSVSRPISNRPISQPLRRRPFKAYIEQIPVIVDDRRLRLQAGGRIAKEICHEQRTADAEGDCRV